MPLTPALCEVRLGQSGALHRVARTRVSVFSFVRRRTHPAVEEKQGHVPTT